MNYIAMYINYDEIPSLEFSCINRNIIVALSEPKVCDVILIINKKIRDSFYYQTSYANMNGIHLIDADEYIDYVNTKLIRGGLDKSYLARIKHNHYADYLAYYSTEIVNYFEIDTSGEAKILKLDTDVYLTSKFALRNIFECNRDTFLGVDEGFIYKYVNGDPNCLPNYFYNAHAVYCTGNSKILCRDKFIEYLVDSIDYLHYTSTGPRLLNDIYEYPDDNMYLPGLTPWTLDPSKLDINIGTNKIELKVKSSALGIHLQSSVLKSIGMLDGEIRYKDFSADTIEITFRGVNE